MEAHSKRIGVVKVGSHLKYIRDRPRACHKIMGGEFIIEYGAFKTQTKICVLFPKRLWSKKSADIKNCYKRSWKGSRQNHLCANEFWTILKIWKIRPQSTCSTQTGSAKCKKWKNCIQAKAKNLWRYKISHHQTWKFTIPQNRFLTPDFWMFRWTI